MTDLRGLPVYGRVDHRRERHSLRRALHSARPPGLMLVGEPDDVGLHSAHPQLALRARLIQLTETDGHVTADDDRTPARLDDDHLQTARVPRRRYEVEPGQQLERARRVNGRPLTPPPGRPRALRDAGPGQYLRISRRLGKARGGSPSWIVTLKMEGLPGEVRRNQIVAHVPNVTSQQEEYASREGYVALVHSEGGNGQIGETPATVAPIFQDNVCKNCETSFVLGTAVYGAVIAGPEAENSI